MSDSTLELYILLAVLELRLTGIAYGGDVLVLKLLDATLAKESLLEQCFILRSTLLLNKEETRAGKGLVAGLGDKSFLETELTFGEERSSLSASGTGAGGRNDARLGRPLLVTARGWPGRTSDEVLCCLISLLVIGIRKSSTLRGLDNIFSFWLVCWETSSVCVPLDIMSMDELIIV